MKYKPDAFEKEDNPELTKVVKVELKSGQYAHMVYSQLLDTLGNLDNSKYDKKQNKKGEYKEK